MTDFNFIAEGECENGKTKEYLRRKANERCLDYDCP